MGYQPLSLIGIEKFSLAVFNDNTYYASSGDFYKLLNMSDIIIKNGYDLTPHIIEAAPNESVRLFTLNDGRFVTLKRNGKSNGSNYRDVITYNDGTITRDSFEVSVHKADGTIIGNVAGGTIAIYKTINGVITTLPTYLFAAIDEDNKIGRLWCGRHMSGGGNKVLTELFFTKFNYLSDSAMYTFLADGMIYDTDPWSNGGYGDVGGGDGDLDLSSDVIALPDAPTSFVDTGFIQLFTPTLEQVKALSDFMWKGDFFDNFLKLFTDPMSILIGLSMFPFTITSGGQRIVHAGNILTTVNMDYPTSQYITIDCGSLDIKHFYDAYIDYDPYTTCQIYLPYIGVQSLSMDDIMGKTLQVIYRVDLMTGICGAYLLCDGIILYTFSGTCSAQIPISGQSFQSIVQSAINIATTTALGAKPSKSGTVLENGSKSAASSLAGNVMSMKPDVSRSGNVSSNVGMLGPQKPYLIFSVARTCLPKGQNRYLGYPAFMTVKLSTLKGYTEVENLRLNNMTCTEEEKREIEELLKGGVIL